MLGWGVTGKASAEHGSALHWYGAAEHGSALPCFGDQSSKSVSEDGAGSAAGRGVRLADLLTTST